MYRDDELSIREKKARSIRRKRLGIIEEEEDENELREVVFEAKTSSLRRSVRKKINKREEVELVKFSNEKRDSVTSESKLLVRIYRLNNNFFLIKLQGKIIFQLQPLTINCNHIIVRFPLQTKVIKRVHLFSYKQIIFKIVLKLLYELTTYTYFDFNNMTEITKFS